MRCEPRPGHRLHHHLQPGLWRLPGLAAASLALLGACSGSPGSDSGTGEAEPTCADEPGCLLADGIPEGLLSVRAPAADDVWVVGASPDPADGQGPALLHYDGSSWTRFDTSAHAGVELWWAWVDESEGVFVGSEGLVLEHQRGTDTVSLVSGPSADITFFGVWGASSDDVWAVGSESTDEGELPAVWRRQGGSWAAYGELPALDDGQMLFKVHGTSADDAWMVGSKGLSLRWDGTAWTRVATDTDVDTSNAPILTVDAGAPLPTAVGGAGNGLLLEFEEGSWRDRSPDFQPGLNGVCSGADQAWAVGQHGSRVRRQDGTWVSDFDLGITDSLTLDDWHGCDVDPEGGLWMVGGHIVSRPLTDGVLGYQGPGEPAAL